MAMSLIIFSAEKKCPYNFHSQMIDVFNLRFILSQKVGDDKIKRLFSSFRTHFSNLFTAAKASPFSVIGSNVA